MFIVASIRCMINMDELIQLEKKLATEQLRDAISDALDSGLEAWQIHDEVERYLGE